MVSETLKEADRRRIVPEPTLRRLPTYHHYLKTLADRGRDVVSCTRIGNDLRLDPTQVRKDLAATGIKGQPKVGYQISRLIRQIEQFLGWDNITEAFLAGAGHLGQALLGYDGFKRYGLKIVAAFDTDEAKIGTKIGDHTILPAGKIAGLAQRMKIRLGIIAVPAAAAQQVAEVMVEGGISGIWNFAPAALSLPPGVIVQNENLASGLAVLSMKLGRLANLDISRY